MRRPLIALGAWLAVAGAAPAQPDRLPPAPLPPEAVLQPQAPVGAPPAVPDRPDPASVFRELERTARELELLKARQGQPGDATELERLRKQVDLLQKQIEVLQKMAALLAEQAKKADEQAATLEGRSIQAARRDQALAAAVDDLNESADARTRVNPYLPSTLKEQFNPYRTNESPIGIYGTFGAQFEKFENTPSNFPSPVFSPHFYMLLNERVLLEVNPEFRGTQVELESCQIDWFAHDNLTVVAGRFYSPIGFFNERLHTIWIYKTPDRPLMFSQVLPASLSFNGLMLKGAYELGSSPFKVEYASFVTNGFSLTEAAPTARDFDDLGDMADGFNDVNGDKAFGGRLGLVVPAAGLWMGVSGMQNSAYDRTGLDLNVVDVDASWRYGNWDMKFEFARTNQEIPFATIHRRGYYAQVAYRPWDACHPILQQLEGVARFDYVRFGGIDPATAALDFGARERSPINRNRYTVGMNYYPYPSLILKVAYEWNDEIGFRDRNDHGAIAQVAWGF